MHEPMDAFELQRLLDGRMSPTERSAFLDCMEDTPEQWRTVALSFIEEQALRKAMSGADAEQTHHADQAHHAGQTQRAQDAPESLAMPNTARQAPPWRPWYGRGAAIAALLVIGVALGWSLPRAGGTGGGGGNAGDGGDTTGQPYVVLIEPATNHVGANDAPQPFAEPGPDAIWASTREALTRNVVDAPTRDAIRQHGYEVNEAPVLYIVQDKDGGRYVIPERHVSLVSHRE